MSMPLYLQPPPATQQLPEQSYSAPSTQGSIGPFIAVLLVVMLLCILAGLIGRLCSGKTVMGFGEYDMERWAESKCSSCIDGRILPPSPPPPPAPAPAPAPPQPTGSDVSESAVPEPTPDRTGDQPESQGPEPRSASAES